MGTNMLNSKLIKETGLSMCSSLENYLHEVADSLKFSNPEITEQEIESALNAASNAVEDAAATLKI
jgi:hypothetical protein